MKYKKLGTTDLDVSLICLGTMTWGTQNSERDALNKLSVDLANSQKDLNNTYAALNSKQSQLDSLLNNDFAKANQSYASYIWELFFGES